MLSVVQRTMAEGHLADGVSADLGDEIQQIRAFCYGPHGLPIDLPTLQAGHPRRERGADLNKPQQDGPRSPGWLLASR